MSVEWSEAYSDTVQVRIIKPIKYEAGESTGVTMEVLPP